MVPTLLPVLTEFDPERIEQLLADDTYFWLDLHSPDDATLAALAHTFGIHELAIEDAQKFGQRPKLDEYLDHVALVYFGVSDVGSDTRPMQLLELHMFVHGEFVVTVRRDAWPGFDHLIDTLGRVPVSSEELVLYRILDALTDSWFALVERIDDDIEDLEQEVVLEPRPEHIQQVMRLKRDLATLRRTVGPARDVALATVTRLREVRGLDHGPFDYFRDVHDHMIRIESSLDSSRMLLSDVLTVHGARVAQQQNKSTERLTLVATIFLPLSFVVGFFGQNFTWMVDEVASRTDFLVWGIGGLVVSMLLLAPVLWSTVRD